MNTRTLKIGVAGQNAKRHLISSLATLLLLTLCSNTARATVITWTNPSGGNWSVATNWSPIRVPGSGDDVYITNYTVTLDFSTSVASLTLSDGTLGGAGSLTVNGPFTWSGGYIENTAGVTLNGTSSLNSVVSQSLVFQNNGLLINAGQLTWSGSGNNLWFNGTGTLTNLASGTITITADVSDVGSGTLGNAGLLTKTTTTGTSTLGVSFVNTGTVHVQSGTVSLNGGGTEAGSITNDSGATLNFGGGTHAVTVGFSATGPGSLDISGGRVSFNSLTASPVSNLDLTGGILGGSGPLTVNGPFTWSGGTIENTAGVTLNGTSSLNSVVSQSLVFQNNGLLINAGQLTWSGSGNNLWFNGTGTLTNLASGTITITADVSDVGSGTLGNAGLLTKTTTTGTSMLGVSFVNTGTVHVQSGTLDWANGVLAGGTFEVSASATLQLDGLTSVNSACSESGAGMVLMSAGTLTGTASFTMNGPFTWSGGYIENTAGVTLNGTSTLNSVVSQSLVFQNNGLLINAGQLTWSGSGNNLWFNGTGTLTNLASGTITITADVSDVGSGTLGNAGLLTKTTTTGTSTLGVSFVNTGTVHVQSGTVSLAGPYTLTNGTLSFGISGATNYGKINLSGAASFKGSLGVNLNGLYWPTIGSAFNLLTYTSESGALFTNTALPPFITWQTNYNPTVFTLSVVARQTNAAPTNLTMSLAGNTSLNLAWPGDHTGWQLEAQTNSLQVGLSTNWVTVPGSGLTNDMTFPIGLADGAVFFRLIYP